MSAVKTYRSVQLSYHSQPTVEGAGVKLRRAFGFRDPRMFDPFLLLDDFRSGSPEDFLQGFPWHPHRGIETITYVLDGDVEHGDSLGNQGVIGQGDVQWMTAGSGIIHQEMPKGTRDGRMDGFQLWLNLPAVRKMTDPRYQGITERQIPSVKAPGGATVRIVAGEVGGVKGPIADERVQPEYLDVSLPQGSSFEHPVKPGHTLFAYVFEGQGYFEPAEAAGKAKKAYDDGSLILFGPGDTVAVHTEKKPVRLLLIAGKPLGEPIAWYGPIVMNTKDQLKEAFEEFEKGTFVKVKGSGAS
jgi:redox-sensitive bicupin YhaK (pirin superfamily)